MFTTPKQRSVRLEGIQRLFPSADGCYVTGYNSRGSFLRIPIDSVWRQWMDEWRNDRDDSFLEMTRGYKADGLWITCLELMVWRRSLAIVLSTDCRLCYLSRVVYPVEAGNYKCHIVSRTCLLRPLRCAQNRLAIRKIVAILLAKLPLDLVTEIAGFAYSHKVRSRNPFPGVNR